MIIFLRQSEISIGTKEDYLLTLSDACFIQVRFIEICGDGLDFSPINWKQHKFIQKVAEDCWLEPFTGTTYDFLFVYPSERLLWFPKHLEICPIEKEFI
jgi:hypothetical protein